MVIALTSLATAAGLEWTHWGQGKWNWGPRLGALLLLVFGGVAFAGTLLGEWLRTGVDWLAGWADVAATALLVPAAGDALAYLIHWMPAVLLGAFWLAAMLPGRVFSERMTWRLAWAGVFLPTFVSAIPGPAGRFFTWVVDTGVSIGAGFIGWLFSLRPGS